MVFIQKLEFGYSSKRLLLTFVQKFNKYKQRGFYEACIHGNEEVVQYFLDHKEKYSIDLEWICLDENRFYPFTAIELAAYKGKIKIIKLLSQCNINQKFVSLIKQQKHNC